MYQYLCIFASTENHKSGTYRRNAAGEKSKGKSKEKKNAINAKTNSENTTGTPCNINGNPESAMHRNQERRRAD
jgi:hypothetical protein